MSSSGLCLCLDEPLGWCKFSKVQHRHGYEAFQTVTDTGLATAFTNWLAGWPNIGWVVYDELAWPNKRRRLLKTFLQEWCDKRGIPMSPVTPRQMKDIIGQPFATPRSVMLEASKLSSREIRNYPQAFSYIVGSALAARSAADALSVQREADVHD